MRDYVVELAPDPRPFLARGLLCALLALALGPGGTSLQNGHVRHPAAHRLADQPRSQEEGGCPAEVGSAEGLAMVDPEGEVEVHATDRVEEPNERPSRSCVERERVQ